MQSHRLTPIKFAHVLAACIKVSAKPAPLLGEPIGLHNASCSQLLPEGFNRSVCEESP
jgi:hypothetical protein